LRLEQRGEERVVGRVVDRLLAVGEGQHAAANRDVLRRAPDGEGIRPLVVAQRAHGVAELGRPRLGLLRRLAGQRLDDAVHLEVLPGDRRRTVGGDQGNAGAVAGLPLPRLVRRLDPLEGGEVEVGVRLGAEERHLDERDRRRLGNPEAALQGGSGQRRVVVRHDRKLDREGRLALVAAGDVDRLGGPGGEEGLGHGRGDLGRGKGQAEDGEPGRGRGAVRGGDRIGRLVAAAEVGRTRQDVGNGQTVRRDESGHADEERATGAAEGDAEIAVGQPVLAEVEEFGHRVQIRPATSAVGAAADAAVADVAFLAAIRVVLAQPRYVLGQRRRAAEAAPPAARDAGARPGDFAARRVACFGLPADWRPYGGVQDATHPRTA
jgi:hypothetical protein